MKSLNLLKTLIDLFLLFAVLGALALIIAVPLKIFTGRDIPISVKGIEVSGSDGSSIALIALSGIGAFFFVYAIFLLRKVLQAFLRNQIFEDDVIRNFKLIGKFIIAYALLTSVPMLIYRMVQENHFEVGFTGGGFDSLLLSVSLGLLFIVIGEIFQKAKNLKEENELTV
ncbi:MAG TPA: DUF2975 domain-containing protein [Flavobacterium sp.]|jgi:hypothetical protein